MKKGFVTIYVLLILLFLSISIAFVSRQVQSKNDLSKDLLTKKQAVYEAESRVNIFVNDYESEIKEYILEDYKRIIDEDLSDVDHANAKEFYIDYNNSNKKIMLMRIIDLNIAPRKDKVYRVFELIYYKNVVAEANIYIRPRENIFLSSEEILRYEDVKDEISKFEFKEDKTIRNEIPDTSKENPYKGVMILDKNMTIDKDLYVDGILISKGKLDTKGKNIRVKGLVIIDKGNKKIEYEKDYGPIIDNIVNKTDLIELEILSSHSF
ncbi:MAG: hypothetical protein E7C95_03330 [Anaerococcus prevotii]|uniref:hypothetical protein n=1 Tax=Anaerococcus prevotii TaxID=33034 RepID=UPI0029026E83|nr:hypothetical protein [Anaerococcus prevotii]MDU2557990.1 hypothetical protein [Anaerococcus prevotii]